MFNYYLSLFIPFWFNLFSLESSAYKAANPPNVSCYSKDNKDWDLQKDQDGIKIYSRMDPVLHVRQIKAITIVNTSLQGAVTLIKDSEAGPYWVNRMIVFKTLKSFNDKDWYTYSEISIPWPFDNRDLITHNTIIQDSLTRVVTISLISTPNYLPEKSGKVRIQRSEGAWIFKPLDKNKVEVTYLFWSEAGKIILPSAFVTPIIVKGIYNTMKNMKEMLAKEKYMKAKVAFIR